MEAWRFSQRPDDQNVIPFSVPYFPRTLAGYLNAVTDAGLRIVRIGEPRPGEEACGESRQFTRWRDIAPFLLMVLAERA